MSDKEYKKEFERLAIDLSWKSSQIEGNTYSLLETERLLIEKETAAGKTKEEAVMLLNHKDALDFIIEAPDYLNPLSVLYVQLQPWSETLIYQFVVFHYSALLFFKLLTMNCLCFAVLTI